MNTKLVHKNCYIIKDKDTDCKHFYDCETGEELTNLSSQFYYNPKNESATLCYINNTYIYFPISTYHKVIHGIDKIASAEFRYRYDSFDVAKEKNSPSKRVISYKNVKESDFATIAYLNRDYKYICAGKTRYQRELIVMDIDHDIINNKHAKKCLSKLMTLFAKNNINPSWTIFDTLSNHIQLQWLLSEPINIKETNKNLILDSYKKTLLELDEGFYNFNNLFSIKFSDSVELENMYKNCHYILNNIVPEFGDDNYRRWRCKNPFSGIKYGQQYITTFYTNINGSSKFSYQDLNVENYFNKKSGYENLLRYDFKSIFETLTKLSPIIKKENIIENDKVNTIKKIDDSECILQDKNEGRNSFVLRAARNLAFKTLHENNITVNNIANIDKNKLFKSVFELTKANFELNDKDCNGKWEGTSNVGSEYTENEMVTTVKSSINFVISKYNTNIASGTKSKYTEKQLEYSKLVRKWKMYRNCMYIIFAKRVAKSKKAKDIVSVLFDYGVFNISKKYIYNHKYLIKYERKFWRQFKRLDLSLIQSKNEYNLKRYINDYSKNLSSSVYFRKRSIERWCQTILNDIDLKFDAIVLQLTAESSEHSSFLNIENLKIHESPPLN